MEATASLRALGYAKDLPAHGIELTVLTFNWQGKFDDSALPSRIIRLDEPDHAFTYPSSAGSKVSAPKRKYTTFRRFTDGNFDPIHASVEAEMTSRAEDLIKEEHFDGIVGIFSPHFHLRQCARLERLFGIPFIIDFRDLWNNAILGADQKASLESRIKDALVIRHWKKWMTKAAGFTAVSEPFKAYLSKMFQKNGAVVRNGFFAKDLRRSNNEQYDTFTLTHVGTIVQWEGMRYHLEYLNTYREKYPEKCFRILLIGVHSFMEKPLASLISRFGLAGICEISSRIPFEEARTIMRKSHVLLFPVFRNGRGIYTSRIFEFLAARRPILAVPEDNDVISNLISSTKAGFITAEEQAYHDFVNEQFDRWHSGETALPGSDLGTIEFYSREAQNKIFAQYLKACFSHPGDLNR